MDALFGETGPWTCTNATTGSGLLWRRVKTNRWIQTPERKLRRLQLNWHARGILSRKQGACRKKKQGSMRHLRIQRPSERELRQLLEGVRRPIMTFRGVSPPGNCVMLVRQKPNFMNRFSWTQIASECPSKVLHIVLKSASL